MHGKAFCVLSAVIAVGLMFAGAASPASAAVVHQNGADYAYWQFQGPGNDFWNVDQEEAIIRKASYTYWAMQFTFTGSGDVGYMGLQTNGNRFDGSVGDTAIFSLWNANATRDASGKCGSFGGEGTGRSCRMPFSIKTRVMYRLRVWRLEADSGGQWWGAWLLSGYSGYDYHIGDIRVPYSGHQVFGEVLNFNEYFGPVLGCDSVPLSDINLTQPAANSYGDAAQTYQYYSYYSGWGRLNCTGGSATPIIWPVTAGAEETLGGHR
jgi:hypothetical protein